MKELMQSDFGILVLAVLFAAGWALAICLTGEWPPATGYLLRCALRLDIITALRVFFLAFENVLPRNAAD